MDERQTDIAKLAELIKDVKFAMFTTRDPDGTLHSRPMGVQQVEFDGDLWFFTKEHSEKVSDVEREQHVNVSFADVDKNLYISVSGLASPSDDREKMKELWSPAFKAWFPDGLEDSELFLIKVRVTQAEYWDAPGSKFVQLFGMAKAAVTGHEFKPGEHAQLEFPKGTSGGYAG